MEDVQGDGARRKGRLLLDSAEVLRPGREEKDGEEGMREKVERRGDH